MKILVILTGGTIACKTRKNIMDVGSDTAYNIIHLYNRAYPNNIEFEVVQPFTILSENYTVATYNTLIDYLYRLNFSQYDGAVITHGSDTLSYTSALVAMLINDVPIPVLLTAADYPLDNPLSNGLSNFSACVEFIKNKIANGIFTVYGKKDNAKIYLATRINEADPISDSFSECGNGIVAEFEENHITKINGALLKEISGIKTRIFKTPPIIKENILLIKTYPNQSFDCYYVDNVSAVVIYMYHSATACTVGNNTNILHFIKRCLASGVDIHLASYEKRESKYITGTEIERLNINKLYNISKESAYIKALLAYNQTGKPSVEIMNTNIYYECQ